MKYLLMTLGGFARAALLGAVQTATAQEPAPAPAPVPAELAIRDDPDYHMVAIEALVVEVNEDRTRDLGLSYGFNEIAGPDGTTPGIINGADIRMGRALSPVRVPVLLPGGAGTDGGGRRPGGFFRRPAHDQPGFRG